MAQWLVPAFGAWFGLLFHTNTTTMTNNLLHGLLCIFTGGLWLPCWLLACCCDDDEGNRHHHHRNNNNNTTIINQNINSSGERRPLRGKAQQAKKKGNAVNNGTSGQVSETLADGARVPSRATRSRASARDLASTAIRRGTTV